MHYVIYPDTLFLENFLCNLLLMMLFKQTLFPAAGKRIAGASMAAALCNTVLSILFLQSFWFLQVALMFPAAGIMIVSCVQGKDRRRILYLLYQMIIGTLVLGGIFQMMEQWSGLHRYGVLLVTAIFSILFGIFEKIRKICKRQNDCIREVVLYWNGKSHHVCGFADTGNQLFDPLTHKPVCIISKEAWEVLLKDAVSPEYHFITYQTVGKKDGILWGTQIDYMVILEGANSRLVDRPVIAITEQPFTGIFHYSILLHNDYC